MPGYVHYDFGDAIRTVTNTAAEDEKELSKVRMDITFSKPMLRAIFLKQEDTLNEG